MAVRSGSVLSVTLVLTIIVISFFVPSVLGSGQGTGGEGSSNLSLTLKPNEVIRFKAKDIERVGIYNPHFWTENNERSTSKDYDLWKKADVYLIEWPGNITIYDPFWPLLKWTKPRAKYLVNHCVEHFVGIEMQAYAYQYLFLTWGPFRFLRTYSPPLTVPGELVPDLQAVEGKENRTEIPITDFAFVGDALLITTRDEGAIIRVYGLEMTYAELSGTPLFPLQYAVSKGISSPVNKLVTQHCCSQMEAQMCPFGETVVAYREHSSDFGIFVSSDGGMNFKKLRPEIPATSSILHSVLSYPVTGKILVLHGTETMATLDSYSMSTGALISNSGRKSAQGKIQLNGTRGMLQGNRIGEEMSLIIWDQCNVWYSNAEENNLTKAVFYVHGSIRQPKSYAKRREHYIVSEYCNFGIHSSLALAKTGKLALLDSKNVFFLGVDTKSTVFQLVAMKVDMSLILPKHNLSIVPHFDLSEHPKLVYPPRFLEVHDKAMLGKNYSRRLGMRLLPKTVFPSEFITVFYEENAWLPKKFKNFALRPCQTSSLSVNRSITQKPKFYTFSPLSQVNFTVVFKSRLNASRQLNYEPKDVTKFLEIRRRLLSVVETNSKDPQYIFTYEVIIKSRSTSTTRRTFLINFFTQRAIRCNLQPSNAVYIKIYENPQPTSSMMQYEMSKGTFLQAEGMKTEYGKTYKAETCNSCSASESKSKETKCSRDPIQKESSKSEGPAGAGLHSIFGSFFGG